MLLLSAMFVFLDLKFGTSFLAKSEQKGDNKSLQEISVAIFEKCTAYRLLDAETRGLIASKDMFSVEAASSAGPSRYKQTIY